MNKERASQIAEWIDKGAEWCATQLWNARKSATEVRARATLYRNEAWKIRGENRLYESIQKENEKLKEVLEDNGIRPKKLRLYYRLPDCDHCKKIQSWEEMGIAMIVTIIPLSALNPFHGMSTKLPTVKLRELSQISAPEIMNVTRS